MSGTTSQVRTDFIEKINEVIRLVILNVPPSHEALSPEPKHTSEQLAATATWKAAAVAGALAIVPGPAGMLTIIPALDQIWRIQRQLVADIAACHGQTAKLSPTLMTYCLFRHGSGPAFDETVVQLPDGSLLVKEASILVVQKMIAKVSVNVAERVLDEVVSRWLPLIGATAIGAYTYHETKIVAANATETFEKVIETEKPPALPHIPPPLPS